MSINNRVLPIKLKLLLFFLSALAILSCSSVHNQSENTNSQSLYQVKVMTFNIRYGSADDGENSWQFRRNILFDVIKNYNPDLLGMQEVLKFQLDELVDQMPNYSSVGAGRDDGKTQGEYSPILFSKYRYIVDTTETFWFSDTPKIPGSKGWGNNITRICTWAKLFDKFTSKTFYFLNVHLDHQSPESRLKSAQALVDKIRSFNDKLPVILTGDFNTSDDEETISVIKNYGLIDTYHALHPRDKNEGTFHSFTGDNSSDKIDFIFISKKFNCLESQIIKTNNKGRYPSDHFPVTTILEYIE